MTTKTKKILVAILLCLVLLVTVCLGVFCFIPDFEVNDYGDFYQSEATVLQKSSSFTNSVKAQYSVKLDEDADVNATIKAIKTRLVKAYGYYGSKVEYDEANGTISIEIPESSNKNTSVQYPAKTILSNLVSNGVVEIINSDSYSKDNVVLTQEHFKSARIRSYVNLDRTMFVCRVKLTKEGKNIAKEKLVTGTPYYCALDGSVDTYVYYASGEIQIYYTFTEDSQRATYSARANAMLGYISSGSLGATLTQEGNTATIENNLGWIFYVVFGVIVLASFVFFAVRYRKLSIIPIILQALVVFIFLVFGALVYLEIFNIAMAVGVILAYVFMSFFTAYTFEKLRVRMQDKSYSWARKVSFNETMIVNLIAHGSLLVLGIILWVIPTVVTAPLGNALVYGAILSFVVTFGLNRLFALLVSPFFEDKSKKTARK